MEKNILLQVVGTSSTIHECLVKLGRNDSSASYKLFKNNLKKYNINIDHFKTKSQIMSERYNSGDLKKSKNEDIFIENSKISRNIVKKRIIDEKLIPYECSLCKCNDDWFGKKIVFILDHINGINNDNRLENLRFVCPNCNSTLETHCMGHKGLIKVEKIDKRTIRKERFDLRKIKNRPTKEELIKLLNDSNFSKVGRSFGVSDTTIRKWAKKYEII